jgi:hypothetical protein
MALDQSLGGLGRQAPFYHITLNARKNWGFQRQCKASWGTERQAKLARRVPKPTKPKEPATQVWWEKKLGVSRMQGKLGVSRGNARQVGKRGAQRQAELARRAPKPTKPKDPVTQVWWEKNLGFPECKENLGFPEEMQGKLARGVPKGKPSWQEERPSQQNRKSQRHRCGGEKNLGFPECKENLGFPEEMQGKLARGAPKSKLSWQEERPTNKTEGASDTGVVEKKTLGFPNARKTWCFQRQCKASWGAQRQAKLARRAPNQQN